MENMQESAEALQKSRGQLLSIAQAR